MSSEVFVPRIPARAGLIGLRYLESDGFGGPSVTFGLGPVPTDVRARVDSLSDAGDPESWTNLEGTMWVSSKSLEREGVVVEFELFGTDRGERSRFHAQFLTPP